MEWYHAYVVVYLAVAALGIMKQERPAVVVTAFMMFLGLIYALIQGDFFS